MTVSSEVLRNDYVGDGLQTVFQLTVKTLLESTESGNFHTVKVILTDENDVETVQIEDADYTVALNDELTGTITFLLAPPLDYKITFLSNIASTQKTDYINLGTGKFPADSHEKALDKLTLLHQQQEEKVNRAVLLPESSTLDNLLLPISPERANQVVNVNNTGDNLTTSNLAEVGLIPVSTFMSTFVTRETAEEARTTLDAEQKANSLTEKLSEVVADDKFIIADSEDGNNSKKISFANLFVSLTGEIKIWSASYVPSGYLECNGAEVAIASYNDLTNAIYVGDGNNSDIDLVFGYKTDGIGNRTITGTHIKLPDLRGEFIRGWDNGRAIDSSRKLGSYQADEFKSHNHQVIEGSNIGAGGSLYTSGDDFTNFIATFSTSGGTGGTETRPRNISLMYIIKT